MRGGTLQINWHDQQPVLSLDFHPASRRLATAGADHDIKVGCPLLLSSPLSTLPCFFETLPLPHFGGGVP